MTENILNNSASSQPDTLASQSESEETTKPTYVVGYGKPPLATRFRKGRSANPKGRKKKPVIEDVRTVVEQFFDAPVKVREGGQVKTLSKMETILRMRCNKALQGNAKAALALFRQAQKTGQFTQATPQSGISIVAPGTPEEQRFLRIFHATNDCYREGPSADDACGFLRGNRSRRGAEHE